MANFVAYARTNYFNVRDIERLKADLIDLGIHPATWAEHDRGAEFVLDDGADNKPKGSIALFSFGPWPSLDEDSVADRLGLDPDEAVGIPVDTLHDLVATHLEEDSIAVFMEVGHEKLRYLTGTAVAVNAQGESERVDLDDIYQVAADNLLSLHARAHGAQVSIAMY